ncbi:FtsX-like permease family protein [Candidatus Poribacteria bacterium]|nr:FtsX-like permease family protein [Candidatus Poribacteria bacterium]
MGLILKIAFRNIFRHKGKSIIIGVILFLGSFIMTIGNGIITGMDKGLEENIVNGFTGDLVIISDKNETDNVLFTLMGKAIEPINNYLEIKKTLEKQNYIKKFLPAGRNMALILNEEGGSPGFAFLLGVDFAKYAEMFPNNVKPVEGRLPIKDEQGALIPTGSRKEFYNYMGLWFIPENTKFNETNFRNETEDKSDTKDLITKDSIVFLGNNEKNTTMDIRLPVKGVIKFKALNTIFGHYNIIDIESYRECLGYFSASTKAAIVPEEKKKMLEMENQNIDSMFSDDNFMVASTGSSLNEEIKLTPQQNEIKEEKVDIETGTYNVVFVKLAKGISLDNGLEKINKELKDTKHGVRAVSWKKAFGVIGSMATIIKGALFGFVMLLFVVAIIIIVNTLSMTALERTSEIGMMRAIGARKSFISNMFLAETSILSFMFGGTGIVIGYIIIKIIPLFNITSANDLVQILYGGDKFRPVLYAPDILLTIIQLILVTIIAVIYPIKVAKSITPLDAIVRD